MLLCIIIGNGEIDFEEFLTLMTSTEKFLENLRGKYCCNLQWQWFHRLYFPNSIGLHGC